MIVIKKHGRTHYIKGEERERERRERERERERERGERELYTVWRLVIH